MKILVTNTKGDMSVNSYISLIISVIVILLLFKCGSQLITSNDDFAESQMLKLNSTIKEIVGPASSTSMTIKMGDAAYFAYFAPGQIRVRDNFATLVRPGSCGDDKDLSCFCYCDRYIQTVKDGKYLMTCKTNKDIVCNTYDTEFKIPSYEEFYDTEEKNSIVGGFFMFKTVGSLMHNDDNIVGFSSKLRPYDVAFRERLRFEQDSASKVVTICMRENGRCTTMSW